MSNSAFRGLPDHVQKIVLDGLTEEVRSAKAKIRDAEAANPIDNALLRSLKGDAAHSEDLHARFNNGQD